MKSLLFVMIILLVNLPLLLTAQQLELQVIGATGGVAEAGTGTLDWTLGELCTHAQMNENQYIGAGFQQVFFSSTTAVEDRTAEATNFALRVYPNPTARFLKIESDIPLQVQLLDLTGRVAIPPTTANYDTQLDMSHLPGGMYLLRVFDETGRLMGTTKVQRIQ